MKNIFIKPLHLIYTITILIILLYIHLTILDFDNYLISKCSYIKMILSVLIETGLIISPVLLNICRLKYMVTSIIIVFIVSFANIFYGRFFHSYFSLVLIGEYKNLSGLSESIFSIINIFDIFYIVLILFSVIVILVTFYSNYNKRTFIVLKINNLKLFLIVCSICVLEVFITYGAFTWKAFIPNRIIYTISEEKELYNYNKELYTFRNGIINTYIRECLDFMYSNESQLSNNEVKNIKDKIRREYNPTNKSANNIILIIVESLMSFPIDLVIDEIEITPTLNKLKEEGYYNPNMLSQIEKGMSSDGQFMYFTGLLPHTYDITVIDYLQNEYKGLGKYASQKGMKSIMVIPTTKHFWHQEEACESYGVESLWSKENYHCTLDTTYVDEWLNDEQIFNYSRWICEDTSYPFFLTILTSSMHMPYYTNFDKAQIQLSNSKYSYEYINYLQKINYTDNQLGKFIQNLKNKGLYDNSIIIIASDHKAPIEFEEVVNYNIPLIITKCNHLLANDTIGQIDVFPTIMDIMNVPDTIWRGVGYSIYTNKSTNKINYSEQVEISNLLLESNFFKYY